MPAAFRRSVEGEKAIKQQMRQLFRLAEDKFSEKPLVNQKGEFTIPGLEGIAWEELVQRAPAYFSALFHKVRGRLEFGNAVYQVFEKCYSQLKGSPPVRKRWANLLLDIPKGSLKPLGTDGTAASASSAASKPS